MQAAAGCTADSAWPGGNVSRASVLFHARGAAWPSLGEARGAAGEGRAGGRQSNEATRSREGADAARPPCRPRRTPHASLRRNIPTYVLILFNLEISYSTPRKMKYRTAGSILINNMDKITGRFKVFRYRAATTDALFISRKGSGRRARDVLR